MGGEERGRQNDLCPGHQKPSRAVTVLVFHAQVNVLYLLPSWLGPMVSHPLIKTHPDRSGVMIIVYGTPYVPFKYKRRVRSAGFRDVIYG